MVLHVQAFRLAEEFSVARDGVHGRLRPHPRVRGPGRAHPGTGGRVLPPFHPRQVARPGRAAHDRGPWWGPEAFRRSATWRFHRQQEALARIPEIAEEFRAAFGRDSGGLLHTYRCEDATSIVLAMGSVLGTLKDTVDGLRDDGERVGVVGLTSFRPFPMSAVWNALRRAERVITLERAFSPGVGGIVSANVHMAPGGVVPAGTTR